MFRRFLLTFPIYSDALDSATGGGPLGGDPSSAATLPPTPGAGVPASGAAGPGAGQPVAMQPPAGDARPGYSYPEDRSRWIPPHRFNEVSQEVKLMRDALLNYQSRVRALMGVAEPEDPRDVELRNALKTKFPGLARFIDQPDLAERLMNGGAGSRGGDDSFQQAYWQRHATEMVSDATTAYAKAAGIDASRLGPQSTAHMARQLQAFIAADPSGERREQYERRDPGFIQTFIADLTGFFVNPLRATATVQSAQQVERNRSLPSTRGPSGVPPGSSDGATRPRGKQLHEAARQALLMAQG